MEGPSLLQRTAWGTQHACALSCAQHTGQGLLSASPWLPLPSTRKYSPSTSSMPGTVPGAGDSSEGDRRASAPAPSNVGDRPGTHHSPVR